MSDSTNTGWRTDFENAPKGDVLLYFHDVPDERQKGRIKLYEMLKIGNAAGYPNRPPSHWMPLPQPPEVSS
jgi:hypothetical protein